MHFNQAKTMRNHFIFGINVENLETMHSLAHNTESMVCVKAALATDALQYLYNPRSVSISLYNK